MSTLNEKIRDDLLRFEEQLKREGVNAGDFELERDEEFEQLLRDCFLLYGEEIFPSVDELTDLLAEVLEPEEVRPPLVEKVLSQVKASARDKADMAARVRERAGKPYPTASPGRLTPAFQAIFRKGAGENGEAEADREKLVKAIENFRAELDAENPREED